MKISDSHLKVAVGLFILVVILVLTIHKGKVKDGYPGPGKCVGAGPKPDWSSDPCCNMANDLYNNDDQKICDYDSWSFEHKGQCIGYGRTRADCVANCAGDSSCVAKCPVNYPAFFAPVKDKCSNKPPY